MKRRKSLRIDIEIPEHFDKIETIHRIMDAGLLEDFLEWLRREKSIDTDNIKVDEVDYRLVFEYAVERGLIETFTDLDVREVSRRREKTGRGVHEDRASTP